MNDEEGNSCSAKSPLLPEEISRRVLLSCVVAFKDWQASGVVIGNPKRILFSLNLTNDSTLLIIFMQNSFRCYYVEANVASSNEIAENYNIKVIFLTWLSVGGGGCHMRVVYKSPCKYITSLSLINQKKFKKTSFVRFGHYIKNFLADKVRSI